MNRHSNLIMVGFLLSTAVVAGATPVIDDSPTRRQPDSQLLGANGSTPAVFVDFTAEGGRLEPRLHSSGFAPVLAPRPKPGTDEKELKPFRFFGTRTHDWALVSAGQRIVDVQNVFPLINLDATDPKNYTFKPTDEVLRLAQDMGLEIFYRLGTSIEHTEDGHHFNAVVNPEDYEKYAEACAGIVRHYTRGWADGFTWKIPCWEIWNEPDNKHCWGANSKGWRDESARKSFARLYAVILKRLKSEFPELKVGGPALVQIRPEWFDEILAACAQAGVKPDFISWHAYQMDADDLVAQPAKMRAYLDAKGYRETGLVIDEWHYLGPLGWKGMATWATDADRIKAMEGPQGHKGIDSAAYTLYVLTKWQDTPLDAAYFYGIRRSGNWGYLDSNFKLAKVGHALALYGAVVHGQRRAKATTSEKTVSALAVEEDGVKKILIADYRGTAPQLELDVRGLAPDATATVQLLDHTTNRASEKAQLVDGRLTLRKRTVGSAAWLVTF